MKHAWRHFRAPLKPGVLVVLAILVSTYLLLLVGHFSHAFNLYDWTALRPSEFWRGRLWEILTYALVPFGVIDLAVNGFMIAWLGAWMERIWSRGEFWIYCLVSVLGNGLARVLLTPSSFQFMVGSGGIAFGLLAAWARIFGHERVLLMAVWEMSVRQSALLIGAFGLLITLSCAGPINTICILCGALAGWTYLSARERFVLRSGSQVLSSERIGRLEL